MYDPCHRRVLCWIAALLMLALLAQIGVVLRNQHSEPDAAVVLEGDPQRIRYGAQLAKAQPSLPIYISSEPVFYQVYLDALAAEQVPIERFALRTCATDTLTNLTCIAAELKARGYRHLYMITSAHHMPRALSIGRIVLGRHGIAVTPLPVASGEASKESLLRILRDALRALLWAITGITGPEKIIHPTQRASASAAGPEQAQQGLSRSGAPLHNRATGSSRPRHSRFWSRSSPTAPTQRPGCKPWPTPRADPRYAWCGREGRSAKRLSHKVRSSLPALI